MRVLSKREWVWNGEYDPIAYFEMTVNKIATKNGFWVKRWDGDGVGRLAGQFLKSNAGDQYYLEQTLQNPKPEWRKRTALYVHVTDATHTSRSVGSLTNSFVAAMQDLKIPLEKVVSLHKGVDAERANWILGMGLNPKVERFSLEYKG